MKKNFTKRDASWSQIFCFNLFFCQVEEKSQRRRSIRLGDSRKSGSDSVEKQPGTFVNNDIKGRLSKKSVWAESDEIIGPG